jgi:hypothetical protein
MPLNVPSDTGPLVYGMDGLLGVGTEKPTEKLDIAGNGKISGTLAVGGAVAVTGAFTPTGGLAAAAGFSASPRCIHTGGITVTQVADGNDTTPVVTETYLAEVFVPANMTITGIAIFNGSVAANSLIAVLYDSTGAVVANSALAGTAASGTDAFQRLPFTTPYAAKGPATYYVGLQANGTSYRFNSHIAGNFGASKKTAEVFGTLTTITPPTTFTTAQGPIASLY